MENYFNIIAIVDFRVIKFVTLIFFNFFSGIDVFGGNYPAIFERNAGRYSSDDRYHRNGFAINIGQILSLANGGFIQYVFSYYCIYRFVFRS